MGEMQFTGTQEEWDALVKKNRQTTMAQQTKINMKIQEQIINIQDGTEFWKIYFEFTNNKQLTTLQWELINNAINKMIYDFQNK